jgi:ribosomal protein L4
MLHTRALPTIQVVEQEQSMAHTAVSRTSRSRRSGEACTRPRGHMLSGEVVPWTTTPVSIRKRAIS